MLRATRDDTHITGFAGTFPVLFRGLTEERARQACIQLGAVRPLARASLVWEGESGSLTTVPGVEIPLEVLPPYAESDLAHLLERVLLMQTPTDPVLHMVYVPVRDSDLAWIVVRSIHTFYDYFAVTELMGAFIRCAGGETVEPIRELPKALPDLIPPSTFEAAFPRAQELLARGLITPMEVRAYPRVETSEHTPAIFLAHAALSEEETATVTARAKTEGASLVSAAAAAFTMAVAREHGRISSDVTVQLPVGLHPFLSEDIRGKGGSFASISMAKVSTSQSFWDVARALRKEVAETTRSATNAVAPIVALGQQMQAALAAGRPPQIAPPDFTFQSAGALNIPRRVGDIEVVRIRCAAYVEEQERVISSLTFGGRFELVVAARDFAYSRSELVSWFNDGIETLLKACDIAF